MPRHKAATSDILRLNSLGLSLATIAKKLGCHPSTVTQRLSDLNVPPADTRRSFMEDIYTSLTPEQQIWLENQLGPHTSVKDMVRGLMVKEFVRTTQSQKDHHVTQ